jgi:hypothetical protein
MHETLRKRILRRLESLPEGQLYQVLDYIEFLDTRYGERASPEVSGLQTIAERLEDGMRQRTISPTTLREAFQLISAADRVLGSISEVGKGLLEELQAPPSPPARRPPAGPDIAEPSPSSKDVPGSG